MPVNIQYGNYDFTSQIKESGFKMSAFSWNTISSSYLAKLSEKGVDYIQIDGGSLDKFSW